MYMWPEEGSLTYSRAPNAIYKILTEGFSTLYKTQTKEDVSL